MMHKSYDVGTAINSAIGDGAKVENHQHIYGDKALTFPISNVTQGNLCFVGREGQLAVLAANEAGPLAITQAVAGLGGVGKSQLLRQFAHLHRDQYDIIWWVRVDEAWAEDMIALGRRLLLPVNGIGQAAAVEMVRSWLCGCPQRWLLLADNADLTDPRELYPRLPSNPQGRVLLSSRNPNWGNMAQVLTLGVFTPAESEAFWAARLGAGTATEQAARARLAEELGHLPLALEHAAAYMEAKGKGAEAYLRLYQKQRRKLWGNHTHPPTDYHATVATTWQLSFTEVQKTAGAAALLALCAFLAPDDLPLPSLWGALAGLDAEDVPEQLRPLGGDELAQDEAVGALRRYSLLVREETGELGMHRLVQTVYRDQMEEREAQTWVEIAVQWLAKTYRFNPHDMTTWSVATGLIPHLQSVIAGTERYAVENNQVAFLNNEAGFYLQQYGQLRQVRPYYERALAIREKVLGAEHPDTARSLNNLGGLLRAMGDLAGARPYLERALAIWEKVLGAEHPDTARSLNNLGGLLDSMGDLAGARPYYERALAIREKVLGAEHPDTAGSLNNLGYLLQAMGDLAGARPYYERALAIREKVLGAEHPDTARSLNNLGGLLDSMGDLAGARPYLERALAINEKVLGAEHPDTARSLWWMGVLAEKDGNLLEAKAFYQRTLAIFQKTLGEQHPDTQSVRRFLAAVEAKLG